MQGQRWRGRRSGPACREPVRWNPRFGLEAHDPPRPRRGRDIHPACSLHRLDIVGARSVRLRRVKGSLEEPYLRFTLHICFAHMAPFCVRVPGSQAASCCQPVNVFGAGSRMPAAHRAFSAPIQANPQSASVFRHRFSTKLSFTAVFQRLERFKVQQPYGLAILEARKPLRSAGLLEATSGNRCDRRTCRNQGTGRARP